jgi:hypothetical protein
VLEKGTRNWGREDKIKINKKRGKGKILTLP